MLESPSQMPKSTSFGLVGAVGALVGGCSTARGGGGGGGGAGGTSRGKSFGSVPRRVASLRSSVFGGASSDVGPFPGAALPSDGSAVGPGAGACTPVAWGAGSARG